MTRMQLGALGSPQLLEALSQALREFPDIELTIFSDDQMSDEGGQTLKDQPIHSLESLRDHKQALDCLIIAGDADDYYLAQRQEFLKAYNTVDNLSFTLAEDSQQAYLDTLAKDHDHLALVGVDWAPYYYQINQWLAQAILPQGESRYLYHANYQPALSDLVQKMAGVQDAAVYLDTSGGFEPLSGDGFSSKGPSQIVYLVIEPGGQLADIQQAVTQMPQFGLVGDLDLHVVDQESLDALNKDASPAGALIHQQVDPSGEAWAYEVDLKLSDHPSLKANLLLSYARATVRAHAQGLRGALRMVDIPISYLAANEGDLLA